MNRAQRRAEVKTLQKKGMKRVQAKQIVETLYTESQLEEGTPVKLNYELMVRHPDWKIQRDDFKEWVTAHKDDVFTVEWDETRKKINANDKKLMVCLKEDTTEPKWLFHSITLIPQATATVKLDNGESVKVNLGSDVDVSSEEGMAKVNATIQEALEREKLMTES